MQIKTILALPLLQNISVNAKPLKSLKRLSEKKWEAIENNPQFILTHPMLNFISGWLSIRVEMRADRLMSPKIYYDLGDGFFESQAVVMRAIDEGIYQADIMLQTTPCHFRLDPDYYPGLFQLDKITFRIHSEWIHFSSCLFAIMKHDFFLKKDPFSIVRKSYARYKKHGLEGTLERLEKDYIKLYPYKLYRETPQHAAYLQWIMKNEAKLENFEEKSYGYKPLISIITPTYNTIPEYLKETIDSVLAQTYPNWELCIADDASSDQKTLEILNTYEQQYQKIKVIYRKTNGYISEASNSALSLAEGEYVLFLDHDDILAPNALLEIVKKLNESLHLKLIYSDEDKIDEKGRRYDPHFKSGWNPDMFFSKNYISHLVCIKKEVIDKIGGFKNEYEMSYDYDLLLRSLCFISDCEIDRIEKILYHKRAYNSSSKNYLRKRSFLNDTGRHVLQDYFASHDKNIIVQNGLLPHTYKIVYPLPDPLPLVSLLIPTRDKHDILRKCVESILKKTVYTNYEIIILDNETTCVKTLAYFQELQQYDNIRIMKYNHPFNYSAINNFGVKHAKGEVIALINNDIEVITEQWLTEMVSHALRPDIGAVGAMLYYDNDTVQHAGVVLGLGGVAGHVHKHLKKGSPGYFSRLKIVQNYLAVTAACLVVKKELYIKVGGLNEVDLKVAFNDVDFCLKLVEAGYRNLWTPYAELYHHESISRGAEDNPEKLKRFSQEIDYMKKHWFKYIKNDNCYNINLVRKNGRIS